MRSMGKLIYSMIISLDGYTEDERGRFGWGAQEDEEAQSSPPSSNPFERRRSVPDGQKRYAPAEFQAGMFSASRTQFRPDSLAR